MFGDESEICPVTGKLFTNEDPQHSTPIKGNRPRMVLCSPGLSEGRRLDGRQVKVNRASASVSSLQMSDHPSAQTSHSFEVTSSLSSRSLQSSEHHSSPMNNSIDVLTTSYSYPKHVTSTASCTLQNTMLKQRNEIKLLITELRDRDRELNETIAAHQQQLLSWERDRQRILTLEQKIRTLKEKLDHTNRDLKTMQMQLEVSQCEQESTDVTEKELARINSEKQEQYYQLNNLQSLNLSLNSSLKAVSGQVGQLEAREQELVTLLRLKEKDIVQTSKTIEELNSRVKQLDSRCQECQNREADALRRATRWKLKYTQAQEIIDKLMCEIKKKEQRKESVARVTDIQQRVSVELQSHDSIPQRERCNDRLAASLQAKQQEPMCSEVNTVREAKMVGQLEAREQELVTLLRLKESSTSVDELSTQTHNLNTRSPLHDHREGETIKHATQWKQKYLHAQHMMETLWYEVKRKEEEANQSAAMATEVQQQLLMMQESHDATCERERCKDELVESLKAKQERLCDALNTVRELYERQQREVTLLQMNLDSSRESIQSSHHGDHNSSALHGDLETSVQSGADLSRMSFQERLSSFLDTDTRSEKSDTSLKDTNVSPASKLQRLLTESSDLIHSLEQTTIPTSKEMQMESKEVDTVDFPFVHPEHSSASEVFTNSRTFQNLSVNSL